MENVIQSVIPHGRNIKYTLKIFYSILIKFLIEFRCDFDGGDCDGIEEPLETKLPNCPGEAWVGNGKCDDEVNIPECNYDGGIFFS